MRIGVATSITLYKCNRHRIPHISIKGSQMFTSLKPIKVLSQHYLIILKPQKALKYPVGFFKCFIMSSKMLIRMIELTK